MQVSRLLTLLQGLSPDTEIRIEGNLVDFEINSLSSEDEVVCLVSKDLIAKLEEDNQDFEDSLYDD